MAWPSMCWLKRATPEERRRSMALVAGERYEEMIWIGFLPSTSR